jgi:hypothetical protein
MPYSSCCLAQLPPSCMPLFCCAAWGLYGLLSSIMDGPAVLLIGLLGLHVSPHFDKPWLANSTASWWNKRWGED